MGYAFINFRTKEALGTQLSHFGEISLRWPSVNSSPRVISSNPFVQCHPLNMIERPQDCYRFYQAFNGVEAGTGCPELKKRRVAFGESPTVRIQSQQPTACQSTALQ